MKLIDTDILIDFSHEIDYNELRDFVYRAFEDFCGKEVVSHVEVEHFNPNIIDIVLRNILKHEKCLILLQNMFFRGVA